MARRLTSTFRVESPTIQGEDSYVVFRALTVEEARAYRKTTGSDDDVFEIGLDALRTHIVEWNWVDDAGNPLPQPREDPGVIDRLTVEETNFLAQTLITRPAQKN